MFSEALRTNITGRVLEDICKNFDIKITDTHKTIVNILISSIIFKDGSVVILSETIHQINKIIKKHNDKIDFVSILVGIDCISDIDKYGTITIPLALLLNKIKIKRDIVNPTMDKLEKKVMTNATSSLLISGLLSQLGIPRAIAVVIVNVVLELICFKLDDEERIMYQTNTAFKNHKMSETRKMLKSMEFEKIFLSTSILLLIVSSGLSMGSSLILVNIIESLVNVLSAMYKEKKVSSFLN